MSYPLVSASGSSATYGTCDVSACLSSRLTIVGGVRERFVVTRRGRWKTVCARGADPALLGRRSTSPLEAATVRHSLRQRILISVVVGLSFASFGLSVYLHIREGHAAETYQNVYGWNIPWTVPATFAVAFALIGLGALLVRWWQLWRRSRLEGIPMRQVAKELKRDG